MNSCEWCNLSDEDKKYILFQTDYWQVFLADKQDYIGRCILVCKRHVSALSDLTDEEFAHHYNNSKESVVSENDFQRIYLLLKNTFQING